MPKTNEVGNHRIIHPVFYRRYNPVQCTRTLIEIPPEILWQGDSAPDDVTVEQILKEESAYGPIRTADAIRDSGELRVQRCSQIPRRLGMFTRVVWVNERSIPIQWDTSTTKAA
jgi:hypothetical protein